MPSFPAKQRDGAEIINICCVLFDNTFFPSLSAIYEKEAQLSERGRTMLLVIEYFAKSLKITQDDTPE